MVILNTNIDVSINITINYHLPPLLSGNIANNNYAMQEKYFPYERTTYHRWSLPHNAMQIDLYNYSFHFSRQGAWTSAKIRYITSY